MYFTKESLAYLHGEIVGTSLILQLAYNHTPEKIPAFKDFMEKMGMPYNKMEELGIIIPVVDVYAKYKKMVSFGQTVLIRLKIKEFNGVKASFGYEIYDKESKELCTTGFSTHCFLDEKMRPVNIKKKFPEIYDIFNATK